MATLNLRVNGKERTVENVDPADTAALGAAGFTWACVGTKYGCGMAVCGACTVLVDGAPIRACSTPAAASSARASPPSKAWRAPRTKLHPLQQAWIDHDVPQCGYCQAGQLMSASALLARTPKPTDEDIDSAMAGNLCRCGTYQRIRAAIHTAADKLAKGKA